MNFILISDAVRLTGLDRQTIRNWIDKGIIPAQKINGTFYVDKDTFVSLSDSMKDVEGARARLEAVRDEYFKEMAEYRRLKEEARLEHDTLRYLSVCVNSGIRTGFFRVVIDMMRDRRVLNEYEHDVLIALLNGDTYESLCEKFSTTRERIRLIAEKAIRKSRGVSILNDGNKDEEIKSLKDEVRILKKMVYKDAIRETEAGMTDAEKKLARMDRLELITLLSKPLETEPLSVRAMNVLKFFRHEGLLLNTVGDLCKIPKDKIIQQRNAGKKTIDELTNFLTANGLTWGMDIDRILTI